MGLIRTRREPLPFVRTQACRPNDRLALASCLAQFSVHALGLSGMTSVAETTANMRLFLARSA